MTSNAMSELVTMDRHWCLTADRDRVVPETDPTARFLHWIPGQQVDREEAMRLGALDDDVQQRPEPIKQVKPPANKMRGKAADKGAGG